MDTEATKAMIRQHEGVRECSYHDTVGRITVGVGRNLDNKPLKPDEIEYLFANDFADAVADAQKLPFFAALSNARQAVIVDMVFNMGLGDDTHGLRSFTHFLAALTAGNYDAAASAMLASKWAMQVGQRAKTLAGMMRAG